MKKDLFLSRDPHSYYLSDQPKMIHLDWGVRVDFASRQLDCRAEIIFDKAGETYLDLRGLEITRIADDSDYSLPFSVSPTRLVLGECLTVTVPESKKLKIFYKVGPKASGLQWLTSEQTQGKRFPFLFSQAQCLHARSFLPCHDTPSVRFTYSAELIVPKELRGLMAASHIRRAEDEAGAVEYWTMSQSIPSYLMALAVGDLQFKEIVPRCGVWAEPEMVQKAVDEFSDVGKMMEEAEKLFGPYLWERFDMLVLPPSFPYGGMENPRLTFLTPTIVTGDKSMVSVVAHELAHSWTGNLITNDKWSDFWLNEGWTTYAQFCIHEAVYGREDALLHMALLMRGLERDLNQFAQKNTPEFTALVTPMSASVDPDDVFSRVPYCKGALFLLAIQDQCLHKGDFGNFIRSYIHTFKFTSIDTAAFLDFLTKKLPRMFEVVQGWRWVYGPGMPASTPEICSSLIMEVEQIAHKSEFPNLETGKKWSAPQWVLYLELLQRPVSVEILDRLNADFSFSQQQNTEARWAFLLLATECFYTPAKGAIESFLAEVGRMKYILPIFKAMAMTKDGVEWAQEVFARVRAGYHSIAVAQVERILKEAEKSFGN